MMQAPDDICKGATIGDYEKFVANAPKELIEQTKERIAEIEAQENVINDLIKSLQG